MENEDSLSQNIKTQDQANRFREQLNILNHKIRWSDQDMKDYLQWYCNLSSGERLALWDKDGTKALAEFELHKPNK